MSSVRPLLRVLIVLVTSLIAVAALAAPAQAADTYDAGVAFTCPGNVRGTMDRAYNTYLHCGTYVRIVRPDGTSYTRPINVGASQIAPSPDGSIVYGIHGSAFFRAVLVNGSYVLDNGWVPAQAGGRPVCGRGISTDVYGFIYVANGGWCAAGTNQIIKFRPNGTIVTAFGNPGSIDGQFNVDMDVAVTSDGRRIYVADHLNTRVQYFDWQWDGSYRFAGKWAVPSATYDVKLDPWGYAYVTSTTQADIFKYTATGQYVSTVVNAPGGSEPGAIRIHNIAVDARGWVYAPESGRLYRRTADNPLPGPLPPHNPMPLTDTRDPLVTSVVAPAETTDSFVQVAAAASDPDGNAIVQMRIADESGDFRAWTAWTPSFRFELTDGLGTKAVYVQVQDAAGRISAARAATIQRRPVPDLADPVVTITAPTSSYSSSIALGITASDDIGVTHIRYATEEGTFSEWEPWTSGSTTIQRELTAGLGSRVVAVQVRDAAFKVSATAQASIVVEAPLPADLPEVPTGPRDTVAPKIWALVVPRTTCSRRIVLRIAARDDVAVRQVRTAGESGRFGAWRTFSPRLVHFVSRGATRKVVYVQVRDAWGNVSNLTARRTTVIRCA
jgi:hypothetical protein